MPEKKEKIKRKLNKKSLSLSLHVSDPLTNVQHMKETMKIKKGFEQAERDNKWFNENYNELKEKYDGEFIAVLNDKVVDHDASHERLLGRIETKYPEEKDFMVIEFVSKKEIEMIMKTEERVKRIPSILGRDFINRFKLTLNKPNDEIIFER